MHVRTLRLGAFFVVLVLLGFQFVFLPQLLTEERSTPPPPAPEPVPTLDLSAEAASQAGQVLSPSENRQPPAETTIVEAQPVIATYTVRRGDTLELIAGRAGKTVAELMRLNAIRNPDRISVGQVLQLGTSTQPRTIVVHPGPAEQLLPDSEIVYSPAYKDFDIQAVAKRSGGYLLDYRELVEGQWRTGPEIIALISREFSVGPRVLMTLLELNSGWITRRSPDIIANAYPLGYKQPGWEGLYRQTFWAAERLNAAYYLKEQNQLTTLTLFDGDRIQLAPDLDSGTVALQNVVARSSSWQTFTERITNGDFLGTYKLLFGDPAQFALAQVVPADLSQPPFRLPWEDNHTWWFTGGPHNGWAPGSAWAAVDFAPSTTMGTCRASTEWAVAVAPGKVIESGTGRVVVDLDGDGFQGTGWTLLYMHMATNGRVAVGTVLKTGDRIGHPSCEGGISTGTHLHFARLYNGEWISAGDARVPLVMNGWSFESTGIHYDGVALNGDQRLEACGCRDAAVNGILARASLQVAASVSRLEPLDGPDTGPAAIRPANSNAASVPKPAGSRALLPGPGLNKLERNADLP